MNRSARVNASSVSRSLPHSGTSTSHSINTNPFFSRMCYHCGKPGHLWRNCPAIKNTSGGYQSNQPDSSHQCSLLEPVPLNLLDNEHCHISVDNSLVCLKEVRGEYVECNNQLSENLAGVQGRIAKSKNWWFKNLQFSALVLQVLQNGYQLPFAWVPDPCFIDNNESALLQSEFVIKAIDELLGNRCITELQYVPCCYNPLSVVKGKKMRLVIDLSRSVNPYLQKFKFKSGSQ